MCGRYALFETDKLEDRFHVKVTHAIKPNWNVAPTQTMPVIKNTDGKKEIEFMRWGIHVFIGKDKVIPVWNTRSDKAFGQSWKKSVMERRILIPANAFYEWKGPKGNSTPYAIKLPSEELYAFAGIWRSWKDEDGTEFNGYSIMTAEPNAEMKMVHDRMPVILHKQDEDKWLEDSLSEDEIAEMLWTPEDGYLKMYQVSNDVGKVQINEPYLLNPVS